MAETIKSVLFVDYDSLRRSLLKSDAAAADRLTLRLAAWVNAVEAGRLAAVPESGRRKILMRRCYADPATLGDKRGEFTNQGFQVVDCPPLAGRDRSAADIQITLDTIDALGHPTGYDEFILLSADSDFSPLLIRLRAHDRQTVVYANPGTGVSYRAIADGTVEETSFAAFLTATDEVKEAAATTGAGSAATLAAASTEPPPDRVEIEALARKVHAATNVPLFSPRSYLEMFRVLAEEIREKGYHFQETAENVASKLTASGRNANRRQIVFVVKGLALKGHVFSNTDTPEHLAQVFREQVLYLIRNAGLEMSPRENAILPYWIIGKVGQPAHEMDTSTPAAPPAPAVKAEERPKPAEPPKPQTPVLPDLKPPRTFAKPLPSGKTETPPAKPATTPPTPPKQPEPQKPAAAQRMPLPPKPTPPKPAKPVIMPQGQRPGSGAPNKPGPGRNAAGNQPSRPAAPVAPKPQAPKPTAEKTAERPPAADKEAVESTILAAIAQAVDVLVEDRGQPKITTTSADTPVEEETSIVAVEIEEATPEGDSGDIGDEIQRIIASYNRDRQQSEPE